MSKTWIQICLLTAVAVTMFYVSNHLLDGYLRSPYTLGRELKTPEESLYEYRIAKEAPFKYRVLFSSTVNATYSLFTKEDDSLLFHKVYKFWSLVFYTLSALGLFGLLSILNYPKYSPLFGAVIFLFLPPMLMAFTLPVHTRDDTLAYALLFAGLVAFLKNHKILFLAISLVGVLARETLLLLPLLYFVFADDSNSIRRFFIAGLPVVFWLGIRFFSTPQQYDVWE